jgi:hypothetical protein
MHVSLSRHSITSSARASTEAGDEAAADCVGHLNEHDGDGSGRVLQRPHLGTACGQDDIRRERDQLGRILSSAVGIASAPPVVDAQVALRLLHLPDGGQGENNEHHDSHRR